MSVVQSSRIDARDSTVCKPPGTSNVDPIIHHLSHARSAKILPRLGPDRRHGAAEQNCQTVTLQGHHCHPLILVPRDMLLAEPLNLPIILDLPRQQISLPGRSSSAESQGKPPLRASDKRWCIGRIGGRQLLRGCPLQVAVNHLAHHGVARVGVQCVAESYHGDVVVEHDGPQISGSHGDLVVSRQHRIRIRRRRIFAQLQRAAREPIPPESIAALANSLIWTHLHTVTVLPALHHVAARGGRDVTQRHRQRRGKTEYCLVAVGCCNQRLAGSTDCSLHGARGSL
mmetsp:Transcript_1950/g.4422  ORF Transcript_1950/g.4422 Transcript_1950/m.4422 type:complete len:285 (-) Transcript_1950:299-1153(-)